jgi:hypothetical protein
LEYQGVRRNDKIANNGVKMDKGTEGPILNNRKIANNSKIDKYLNITIDPGNSYYSVRVVGAWVIIPPEGLFGKAFKKAKQVVVTSNAQVHGVDELDGVNGLNWIRSVEPGKGYSLGFRTMLADYVPAIGTSFSLEFEYMIIKESPITKLSKKISTYVNSSKQPLAGVLSMDPKTLIATKAISSIASKVTETLFPEETRIEVLKFNGQWQLGSGLKSSYYYIVSAFDKQNLPTDDTEIYVEPVGDPGGGQAKLKYKNGKVYRDNSYVIFEVSYLPVLDDNFNPTWLTIYKSAEEKAEDFASFTPSADMSTCQKKWIECNGIIQNAKAFADQDMRYLPKEKERHYNFYRSKCKNLIWGKLTTKKKPSRKKGTAKKLPEELKIFQAERIASQALRWNEPP